MGDKALRVMVFEDDFLLAGTLADVLMCLGYDVGACVGNFDQAMDAALDEVCDLAVVDLELRGVMAYPVLERLESRGIPFIVATGSARADLPERYRGLPMLAKPYNIGELRKAIADMQRAIDERPAAAGSDD